MNRINSLEDSTRDDSGNAGRRKLVRRKAIAWLFGVALALSVGYLSVFYLLVDERGRIGAFGVGLNISPSTRSLLLGPAMKFDSSWREAIGATANAILRDALRSAREQRKRVMLIFCTESCVGCRHLDEFLAQNASILEKYCVTANIDLKHTFGRRTVHEKYRDLDDGPVYVPWVAILDDNGELLHSYDGPPGSRNLMHTDLPIPNPCGPDANRASFLDLIRGTSPGIGEGELAELERSGATLAKKFGYPD